MIVYTAMFDKRLELTRSEIIDKTGLARTTTYDALTRLELDGFLEKTERKRNSSGRRSSVWRKK